VAGGHLDAEGVLHGEAAVTPCGGCRQSILEAAHIAGRDIEIVSASGDGRIVETRTISALLPIGFGPANLKDAEPV